MNEGDRTIIERIESLSKEFNVSMAAISIAWLWAKGACPIVGVNKLSQIDDYLEVQKITLTLDNITYLEEPYLAKKSLT